MTDATRRLAPTRFVLPLRNSQPSVILPTDIEERA